MMSARKLSDITGVDEDITTEILKTGMTFRTEANIPYLDLVDILGEPKMMASGKSDVEWLLMTEKGLACIYNYKDGRNWLGNKGCAIQEIATWHIGAHSMSAARETLKIIEGRLSAD